MPFLIQLIFVFWSIDSFATEENGFKHFKEKVWKNIHSTLQQIERDPLDAESYFNLGLEFMSIGRTNEEIEAYLESINLYENYLKAHFNIAIAYDRIKDGEKAIIHLIKAKKLIQNNNNPSAYRRIQRVLRIYYQKYSTISRDFFLKELLND